MVSGAVAGVAVGRRPDADGAGPRPLCPHHRVCVERDGAERRPLRSRLGRAGDSPGGEASYRRGAGHPERRPSRVAHVEVSRDAAHQAGWTQGRARQPAAVRLVEREVSRASRRDGREDGDPLRARSQRDRLADRQRVRQRVLRPRHEATVPAVAEGALRHARQPQHALDHPLLEPDLLRLEPDSHRDLTAAIPACC